jgi:phosphotriesterase-related protein
MVYLYTTRGLLRSDEVGAILPHEHIFANFYTGDDIGASASDVVERVKPALVRAQECGVSVLVDATAIGGARRVDILQAASDATGLPVVVATGIF